MKKINFGQWMKEQKVTLIILAVCLVLFIGFYAFAHSGEEEDGSQHDSYTNYEKATVEKVISEDAEKSDDYEGQYVGTQELLIKVKTGDYKGTMISATNYLGALYGSKLSEGDPVVVSIYMEDGEINSTVVYQYDRTFWTIVLLLIFAAVTVWVGGKKGAQSLLGLVITIICLLGILLPILEKGFPTILTTLLLCVYVTIVCFLLLEGLTKKTVCAILGTISGLVLAMLFGLAAQQLMRVDGMRMGDYVDALLQLKQGGSELKLSGLLIAGMLIAALGAIMDVAMSIASAMQELISVNPNLTRKELFKSGMNIGKDVIGTMTNTLILAFVGSSFLLVMYVWTLDVPFYELISSTLVATQVVHSIASSIGVILSVPVTIYISTFFFMKKESRLK